MLGFIYSKAYRKHGLESRDLLSRMLTAIVSLYQQGLLNTFSIDIYATKFKVISTVMHLKSPTLL